MDGGMMLWVAWSFTAAITFVAASPQFYLWLGATDSDRERLGAWVLMIASLFIVALGAVDGDLRPGAAAFGVFVATGIAVRRGWRFAISLLLLVLSDMPRLLRVGTEFPLLAWLAAVVLLSVVALGVYPRMDASRSSAGRSAAIFGLFLAVRVLQWRGSPP